MRRLFGKSEDELKKIAEDQERLQIDLNNKESSLKSDQANIEHEKKLLENTRESLDNDRKAFRESVNEEYKNIASKKTELEKLRSEIEKLQAEAKAGFAKQQREAFKEVIEQRLAELDERQQNLQDAEEQLALRFKKLHTVEGELAKRELAVVEREQKADAGFADQAKALADEATHQYEANQAEAKRLKELADRIASEREQLEAQKAELLQREQEILTAEQKRDAGYADDRASFQQKLGTIHAEKLSELEKELASIRQQRLEDVGKAESAERERIRTEIAKEREIWKKEYEENCNRLASERTELEKQRGVASALQSELEGRQVELETNEKALKAKEERIERRIEKRNADLDTEIDNRLQEERDSMQSERQTLNNEVVRLRESLRSQTELVGVFDQLKQQLGERDPSEIILELSSKTDELKQLREELANRPSEEIRERYKAFELEANKQKERADNLASQLTEHKEAIAEVEELRRKSSELFDENKFLSQRASRWEGAANEAQAELERLRAAYERPAEVDARYKEIELPYIKADTLKPPKKDIDINETTWLTGVENECDSYGLHFHPRILRAFHTALKTAEWSPVTILAGVSGTGKSELPRLYSHFGGLIFEPLSVQPNWDSQESMLGFFNSIDNKFDAQPVLRFLAQSQKEWNDKEGYPGLQDAVCLVLLDEMNLAHPELYFAEFLSKLELRRGMKGTDVPTLPVKIGAGLPPYQLPLGRNVLWTGTMNQDETTKALSDKVLDRSIIIHFPRPTELKRRQELKALDEKNRGPLLHKALWQSWLARKSSLSDDQIKPFKSFIEDMNKALAVAGRAIGHRVWQSVEYYMANYPDVRAAQDAKDENALNQALHVAFEDQLVQKVMPKLRGIDTRGKSKTDCLDKILGQITTGIGGKPFNLTEDFDLACELGYGQFIWQSANYLRSDNSTSDSQIDELTTTSTSAGKITSQPSESKSSKPSKHASKDKQQISNSSNKPLSKKAPPGFLRNTLERDAEEA